MQSRRTILQSIGLSTAGAMLFTKPSHAAPDVREPVYPAPWWLLDPMRVGSSLDGGWKIDNLGPVEDGASVLTIHRDSTALPVHICLHNGRPKGYAFTELFDLIVMDRGRGVRTVPDNLCSALSLLSDIIRLNEKADVPNHQLDGIHRMMTHSERVENFGALHLQ